MNLSTCAVPGRINNNNNNNNVVIIIIIIIIIIVVVAVVIIIIIIIIIIIVIQRQRRDYLTTLTALNESFCCCCLVSLGVFLGNAKVLMDKGVDHRVKTGCEDKIPSHCLSNPCPAYSTCQGEFDSYKCLCPPGFVGKHCENICSLNPCQRGRCVQNNSTAKGFYCVCPRKYTGMCVMSLLQSLPHWLQLVSH